MSPGAITVNLKFSAEFTVMKIRDINFSIMKNTKTEILELLEKNRNEFVSGEFIAESLGITRAAVWKNIKGLKSGGHKIHAEPHNGYSLSGLSDVLSKDGIKKYLAEDTKISNVIYLETVDSTNNYAKKHPLPHGTLIAANEQTAGRGRYGHSFESPAGTGLYMSLVLKPEIEISKFQMITIADAVAVCLAIEDLYADSKSRIKIKWVNDVFFNSKKITGILTEAVTNFESGEIESVITGIGVNVSTKKFTQTAGEFAGSIFGTDDEILFSRNELCAKIADYVMNFAENLSSPDLIDAYRERSLLKRGEKITYMKDGEKLSATVKSIDDSGGLVIKTKSGVEETLRSGEVHSVRKGV